MSNIVRYEMNITSDNYINKEIETKDKWTQLYLLSMEFVLGSNFRISLLHMSKRKIIMKKKERMNEFSFAYIFI